jgi:hypothetical protein
MFPCNTIFSNPPLNAMPAHTYTYIEYPGGMPETEMLAGPIGAVMNQSWQVETFSALARRALQRATQIFNMGGLQGAVFMRVRHYDTDVYSVGWTPWVRTV